MQNTWLIHRFPISEKTGYLIIYTLCLRTICGCRYCLQKSPIIQYYNRKIFWNVTDTWEKVLTCSWFKRLSPRRLPYSSYLSTFCKKLLRKCDKRSAVRAWLENRTSTLYPTSPGSWSSSGLKLWQFWSVTDILKLIISCILLYCFSSKAWRLRRLWCSASGRYLEYYWTEVDMMRKQSH